MICKYCKAEIKANDEDYYGVVTKLYTCMSNSAPCRSHEPEPQPLASEVAAGDEEIELIPCASCVNCGQPVPYAEAEKSGPLLNPSYRHKKCPTEPQGAEAPAGRSLIGPKAEERCWERMCKSFHDRISYALGLPRDPEAGFEPMLATIKALREQLEQARSDVWKERPSDDGEGGLKWRAWAADLSMQLAESPGELRPQPRKMKPEGEWLPQSKEELAVRNIIRGVRDHGAALPEAVVEIIKQFAAPPRPHEPSGVRQEQSISVIRTKIVRTVEMSFRRTRWAHFTNPGGWLICDAWFEEGMPRMQIRSSTHSLEDSEIVAVGIRMAIDWLVEETARGGNVPKSG